VQHPNVVGYHDSNISRADIAIVMEYADVGISIPTLKEQGLCVLDTTQ